MSIDCLSMVDKHTGGADRCKLSPRAQLEELVQHIAHCSLHTPHFARLRTLQVDPLLDESIELRQMLGRSLKTLRSRSDLAPTDPDINAQ